MGKWKNCGISAIHDFKLLDCINYRKLNEGGISLAGIPPSTHNAATGTAFYDPGKIVLEAADDYVRIIDNARLHQCALIGRRFSGHPNCCAGNGVN
jgi:hypothetical protein